METFSDIINGEKPVLVDFYATWCGPCVGMAPIIDSVGKEMQDEIRTLKLDIDKNQAAAQKFCIQSVPTFLLFQRGEILWRHSGAMDKTRLVQQIKAKI